ncbi:hypothetical protein HYX13_04355 [Candidatus Woesearchaeota archaeon]|nr:hypothetical protein [Candidatus Woesearchaeota archaeon]
MKGKKLEVRHVKRVAETEIGGVGFRLDLKSFTADDGREYQFLSLQRGRFEDDEGGKTFTKEKSYTLPVKAAAWLGKELQKNFNV